MLKNGFNFTEDDVNTFLGIDNSPLTDDEIQKFSTNEDDRLIEEFSLCGESRNIFEVLESKSAKEFDYFAEQKQLNQLEANILDLIGKDKRITPEVLAKTLNTDVKVINETLKGLIESKILKAIYTKVGSDQIIERKVMTPPSELEGKKPKTQEILIRYSYEWKPQFGVSSANKSTTPLIDNSRDFCKQLLRLDRFYSRSDIELISERVGYSVWDRKGGWWGNKEECRHRWVANKVIRK
jgi:DNA-binding Lrp family transcriptional regulator